MFTRKGGNQDARANSVVSVGHREPISGLKGDLRKSRETYYIWSGEGPTEVWGETYGRKGGEKERGKGWFGWGVLKISKMTMHAYFPELCTHILPLVVGRNLVVI